MRRTRKQSSNLLLRSRAYLGRRKSHGRKGHFWKQTCHHRTRSAKGAKFALIGSGSSGQPIAWPIDEGTLSKHMILLGAIGMGKSNAMNSIVRSIRSTMS